MNLFSHILHKNYKALERALENATLEDLLQVNEEGMNVAEWLIGTSQDEDDKQVLALVANMLDKGVPASDEMVTTAAMSNDTSLLHLLLDRGGNPNARCDDGMTALEGVLWCTPNPEDMFYAYKNCKLLLQHGADPNFREGEHATPFAVAMDQDHLLAFAEEMLKFGADVNVLYNPVSEEEGYDPVDDGFNMGTPLWHLVNTHMSGVFDEPIGDMSVLANIDMLSSSQRDNTAPIMFLLEHGADVHAQHTHPQSTSAFTLVRERDRADLNLMFAPYMPKKPQLSVIKGGKV